MGCFAVLIIIINVTIMIIMVSDDTDNEIMWKKIALIIIDNTKKYYLHLRAILVGDHNVITGKILPTVGGFIVWLVWCR